MQNWNTYSAKSGKDLLGALVLPGICTSVDHIVRHHKRVDSTVNGTELTIEVASRIEASEILSSARQCADVICLVSIGDSNDELPFGYHNVARKLRLLVADVVTELGATEEDIQEIIKLAEDLSTCTGRVLIHCEAGVSRSTAAALIMYACWFGPGREREAMHRVLEQRPIALPNRKMVEIADKLLDRGGRLVGVLC